VDGGTISNSTVSGNNSSSGTTISAFTSGIWIESSTIAGNTASYALYTSGPATLVNDVFAGTSAGPECGSYGGGSILSLGHNLDDDGTCAGGGPGDLPGQNPQLGALANYGGPTLTRMPAPLSPLANAGAGSNCPPDDQRGVLRNVGPGNACDIGAVEFSVPEPAAAALGVATLLSLGMLRRGDEEAKAEPPMHGRATREACRDSARCRPVADASTSAEFNGSVASSQSGLGAARSFAGDRLRVQSRGSDVTSDSDEPWSDPRVARRNHGRARRERRRRYQPGCAARLCGLVHQRRMDAGTGERRPLRILRQQRAAGGTDAITSSQKAGTDAIPIHPARRRAPP
jgi:hypothetical protein